MLVRKFNRRMLILFAVLLAGMLLVGAVLAQEFIAATEPSAVEEARDQIDSPYSYISGVTEGQPPDDNPTAEVSAGTDATFSYYTVSGPELQPRTTTNVQVYNANGCIYMSTGSGTGLLTGTGMHIPDNAVVKYIRLYYNDTNNSAGVDAFLTRYAPGTATSDLIATGSTNAFNGGFGFVVSAEITETVNNTSYAYMLYGWPDYSLSNLQVCGVRVAYYAPLTFGVFMPAVFK